jgi:hypothetical protein
MTLRAIAQRAASIEKQKSLFVIRAACVFNRSTRRCAP